jgi:hypothetical protein
MKACWVPVAVWAVVGLAHLASSRATEPFRNNDENRHVMTGVFVRDALVDLPASAADPKGYAVRYYAQHPALGLLIWPPLFHLTEGLAMAALGTGYPVARGVTAAYGLLVVWYAYHLTRRRFGGDVAAVAVGLLAVGRLVFDFSRYVLLEVPTLGWVLASVFHFEQYLSDRRPKDAVLACLFAAAAALTRFDGVVLLPYCGLRLLLTGNLRLLLKPTVVAGVLLAAGLTGPYYLLTYTEYAAGLSGAAVSGTNPDTATTGGPADRLLTYPGFLPFQVGWPVVAAAVVGVFVTNRRAAGPWFALSAATYLTFTPLAEPEPRHAIYWLPAVCGLAAVAAVRAGPLVVVPLIVACGYEATRNPGPYLRGYEPVARWVADRASGDRPVLFDGILNGNFVYQLRRADPGRRLWVVRGDKLLYATLSDPATGYTEFAATDADVLSALHAADPEFVVVETPLLAHDERPVRVPGADRLRRLLDADPARFPLQGEWPLDTNHEFYRLTRLRVYRKADRNPAAVRAVAVPVLGMGGKRLTAER